MSEPEPPRSSDGPRRGQSSREALERGVELLQRRAAGREPPVPVPWPTLGALLRGGLWPGLHLLTGPAGSGKTQLLLQLGLVCAELVPTLVVSARLGEAEATARLAGLLSGRPWGEIAAGRTPVDEALLRASRCPRFVRADLARALETPAGDDPPAVILFEAADASPSELQAALQALETPGLALVACLPARGPAALAPSAPRILEKTGAEHALAWIAPPEPWVDAADGVWVLAPSPRPGGPTPPRGGISAWRSIPLAVAKLRSGAPGWIYLRFDGTSFAEETPELSLQLESGAPGVPD